ncbi:MAG TPA: hypothetical protein DIS73_09005 [Planctomycetia bacterium]|nr:hypothetical protein [Planctomycetia bacterium]
MSGYFLKSNTNGSPAASPTVAIIMAVRKTGMGPTLADKNGYRRRGCRKKRRKGRQKERWKISRKRRM